MRITASDGNYKIKKTKISRKMRTNIRIFLEFICIWPVFSKIEVLHISHILQKCKKNNNKKNLNVKSDCTFALGWAYVCLSIWEWRYNPWEGILILYWNTGRFSPEKIKSNLFMWNSWFNVSLESFLFFWFSIFNSKK